MSNDLKVSLTGLSPGLYRIEVSNEGSIRYVDSDRLTHRNDGPAVLSVDGSRFWFRHGEYHREDGPAVINKHGEEVYYLDGIEVTRTEVMGEDPLEIAIRQLDEAMEMLEKLHKE